MTTPSRPAITVCTCEDSIAGLRTCPVHSNDSQPAPRKEDISTDEEMPVLHEGGDSPCPSTSQLTTSGSNAATQGADSLGAAGGEPHNGFEALNNLPSEVCLHEWFEGKCVHCELTALESRESSINIMREKVRASLSRAESRMNDSLEGEIFKFIIDKWGPKSGSDIALKLAEETGELAGAVARLSENRGGEDAITDELGDVLIVASQLAFFLGSTIDQIRADRWKTVKERK